LEVSFDFSQCLALHLTWFRHKIGGTAGNAVAGRLAENPKVRVLVIEAGVG
jgi:hypothetical protein